MPHSTNKHTLMQGCHFVLKCEDTTAQMKHHLTCMTCNVMRGSYDITIEN